MLNAMVCVREDVWRLATAVCRGAVSTGVETKRRGQGTYVHVNSRHERLWSARKSYPNSGGEDLRQAVEPEDPSDFRELQLKGEVGGCAVRLSVVKIVVWIVCGSIFVSMCSNALRSD